ncbi:hypothetical protein F2Q68_00024763 [Brassica cretica]|uniref:P5A-ATPase transmembrane helical hairpin domain-containing protein n=1 Tax=Brassica cretica TaxID=69181 RepID=A0A8S9IEE5_BRACR|nr:hypothetical protein F2Q68_00024763 [Brassica cretica]
MTSFRVGGKVVDKVDLCRKKHWAWRLDVWPFAILYATWLTMIVPSIDFTDATIALGGLVASHVLVLLFTAWSVDFKFLSSLATQMHVKLHQRSFLVLKKLCLFIFVANYDD